MDCTLQSSIIILTLHSVVIHMQMSCITDYTLPSMDCTLQSMDCNPHYRVWIAHLQSMGCTPTEHGLHTTEYGLHIAERP